MKFQLKGTIGYWEEVGKDGGPGIEEICEEFDADNAQEAVDTAKRIAEERVRRYPQSTPHGRRVFHTCALELREIKPVVELTVVRQLAKKRTVVEVESYKVETGPMF